jgi:predicted DNA-binding protein (MmcQ/YjbR family)
VATNSRFAAAAYAGKHGWITVDAGGGLDWDEIRELVVESYRLNAPKRLATAL